jgi:hypothetical protein
MPAKTTNSVPSKPCRLARCTARPIGVDRKPSVAHDSRTPVPVAVDLPPEQGEIVRVRQRRYLVEGVTPPPVNGDQHLVPLALLEDDAEGKELAVLWEWGVRRGTPADSEPCRPWHVLCQVSIELSQRGETGRRSRLLEVRW